MSDICLGYIYKRFNKYGSAIFTTGMSKLSYGQKNKKQTLNWTKFWAAKSALYSFQARTWKTAVINYPTSITCLLSPLLGSHKPHQVIVQNSFFLHKHYCHWWFNSDDSSSPDHGPPLTTPADKKLLSADIVSIRPISACRSQTESHQFLLSATPAKLHC